MCLEINFSSPTTEGVIEQIHRCSNVLHPNESGGEKEIRVNKGTIQE